MPPRPKKWPAVELRAPSPGDRTAFLEAVARSRRLHGRWTHPPATAEQYQRYLRTSRGKTFEAHLLLTEQRELAGVINVSQIVLGVFRSAYLGYYAFEPHAGRGYLRRGMSLVLDRAFKVYGLHRLEANIQPGNERSLRLVQSLGFTLEGYSARYLKIAGRWRDHERWALTVEDWRRKKPKLRAL